jgi:hypothetical protein
MRAFAGLPPTAMRACVSISSSNADTEPRCAGAVTTRGVRRSGTGGGPLVSIWGQEGRVEVERWRVRIEKASRWR